MPRVDEIRAMEVMLGNVPIMVLQEELDYVTETSGWRYIPDWKVLDKIIEANPGCIWFQGIDLDLHRDFYYRDHVPCFVRNRIPPRNRPNIQEFLVQCGLTKYDEFGLVVGLQGLSGNDMYWVRPAGLPPIPYSEVPAELKDRELVRKWLANAGLGGD